VSWWPNPAEIMTRAVNGGATPQEVSKMIWTNRRIWHLGSDSVLVRQDSTGPDKSTHFRYEFIAGDYRARSAPTDLQVWQIRHDSYVFGRQHEDGSIDLGTAPLDELLGPFRRALRSSARSSPNAY
jgi:hypothetical protein